MSEPRAAGKPDDRGGVRERLTDALARLARERVEADQQYNDALTAVDRASVSEAVLPHPPPPYDEGQVTPINETWNVLADGPPAIDRSLKGRARAFVWRLVGPPLARQQAFNAALVDHLNRNVASHREAERAIASLIALARDHVQRIVHFQRELISYCQTITLYVDTKDRSVGGQIQVLNAALGAMTDDWLKRSESLSAREERFQMRVAALDDLRATVALAQQTSLTLKREVERLALSGTLGPVALASAAPAAVAAVTPHPIVAPHGSSLDSFKYVGFEDAFRGSREEIRSRLHDYVVRFAGATDVLDLGCGRGEFLDLLRDQGVRARGLDLNHEMVEVCHSRGLDVTEGEALGYLEGLPDASLGGLFAAQVVEHLEPDYLMRLLETAYHKLRPGALIVLETINPACWMAFFESYIRDLTHVRPIHPDTLQFLLRASGFASVELEWRAPVPESSKMALVPTAGQDHDLTAALAETFNENMSKLNSRLFTYQDYAAIGRR